MDWETVSHQGLNITLLLVVSELIHEGKMIKVVIHNLFLTDFYNF